MVGSWQVSRVGVTLQENWAVNTFFVLFPPYIGFGRRGCFHFSINDLFVYPEITWPDGDGV